MSNPPNASIRELTTCPECGVPVRTDRLEKHINNVHRSKGNFPKSQSGTILVNKSRGRQDIQKESKRVISRMCPYCQEVFDIQGLTRHLSICSQKPKHPSTGEITKASSLKLTSAHLDERSRLNPQATHPANAVRPPVRNKTYIIDEFGVVQSYNTWWENQNLAENVLGPKLAGASGLGRRTRSKARNTRIVICPYCQTQFKAKNINGHVLAVHEEQYPDWSESKNIRGLVACPYCSASVRKNKLTKHIGRVHSGQPIPPLPSPTALEPASPDRVEES